MTLLSVRPHPARSVLDAKRAAPGIMVHDELLPLGDEIGDLTPPLLLLDWSQRGRCTIHFPSPGNERENALPHPARGAEIWLHSGGLPVTDDAWRWCGDDGSSPYEHNEHEAVKDKGRIRNGQHTDRSEATSTKEHSERLSANAVE